MNIDEWARKISTEVDVAGDERAPVDIVMLAHLDEFEEIARATRLKIPAFARALTRAGLTLRSGKPYSAETLRAQINRARAKRKLVPASDASSSLAPSRIKERPILATVATSPAVLRPVEADRHEAPPGKNANILEKLDRLKPRRPKALGSEE